MDFGKSFSYVFDDPDWLKKIAIGGVINLVPILNFAAAGYAIEVVQRVIHGDVRPLPEWDDIGGKLVKGLIFLVISIVYSIPLLILACLYGVLQGVATAAVSSPSSSDAATSLIGILSICFSCIQLLYYVFLGLVLPPAIGNYAARNEFGAAFRFGEIMSLLQKNPGLYFMVLLIVIVAGLVSWLGLIACLIGVAFTAFYSYLVMAYATAQAYREASANIGLV